MNTIDYEKYSNMNQKQLLNCLLNAEKKEQKIKLEMQQKLSITQDLIKFLKVKIKESLDKPKYEFMPLEKTGLKELTEEIERTLTPQELEEIDRQLEGEINRNYNDGL